VRYLNWLLNRIHTSAASRFSLIDHPGLAAFCDHIFQAIARREDLNAKMNGVRWIRILEAVAHLDNNIGHILLTFVNADRNLKGWRVPGVSLAD